MKKISVILPCYNEEDSIKDCIEDFTSMSVDEIIAIDNNSYDNTKDQILKTNAKYIYEKNQGYGNAILRGLKEARGDLIVICEPDGTFQPKDLIKLLSYSEDFDAVFGTRTSKSAIKKGAKMQWYLRYGNIIVAKLLEYLFFGPTLTDVGCTFKLFNKKCVDVIIQKCKVKGSALQPEIMIHLIKSKKNIIEIPLIYKSRLGYSKITYSFNSSLILALKMIFLILKMRIFRN